MKRGAAPKGHELRFWKVHALPENNFLATWEAAAGPYPQTALRDAPVIGIACVIDHLGYNARYAAQYLENRWMLCKTAFSVVVERAAKFAVGQGQRLRVMPEKCNKTGLSA